MSPPKHEKPRYPTWGETEAFRSLRRRCAKSRPGGADGWRGFAEGAAETETAGGRRPRPRLEAAGGADVVGFVGAGFPDRDGGGVVELATA